MLWRQQTSLWRSGSASSSFAGQRVTPSLAHSSRAQCLNILRTAPQYVIRLDTFRMESAIGQQFLPMKTSSEDLKELHKVVRG